MLHRRYVLADLHVGDRRLTLRHGDVVIAARAESGSLDWEVVVHTLEPVDVARQVHELTLSCIVGADDDGSLLTETLTGPAFLVRAVDRALVFRGDGPLDGIDLAELL
jgi:hypothetical protein